MEQFIEEKLAHLSLSEKVFLLAAADMWHTIAIEKAGIPILKVTDGPNGARPMPAVILSVLPKIRS